MISRLKDTLLLVGSASSDRVHLRNIFESGYNLLEAGTADQAKLLLDQNISCIAAVLADIPLVHTKDIRKLAASCRTGTEQEVPLILFITPIGTGEQEELAFTLGATDVVRRPYTPSNAQRRVQTLVDLYLHKWHLEKLATEQSKAIRNANQIMLDALSAIIEHRNAESGNHVLRIRRFTQILLEAAARSCPEYHLTPAIIDSISSACILHDIGKISIPDAILTKPGPLTKEEYAVMQTHTTVGGQLVQNLVGMADEQYLRYAYNITLYHHERWDGRGYPYGLKGDDIPICAQAVGLADAFDALTTARAYKPAYSYEKSINMILNGECGSFSPKLLECFKQVRVQLTELAQQYADGYSPKSDAITVPLPAPVWEKSPLDSVQLSHVKYQSLLHYINDTVVEVDLDHKLFHVVYNPYPDLETLFLNASYEDSAELLLFKGVHPDDAEPLRRMWTFCTREFFRQNLHKKSCFCRIYSPIQSDYLPYEITLLRVNTQNAGQRILQVIFRRAQSAAAAAALPLPETLHASPAMYGMVSSALRCHADAALRIAAGARDLYPLTGYAAEEILRDFGCSYLELVVPEDREALLEIVEALPLDGSIREAEYRLLRKDGTTLWVLTKCRAVLETDGRTYIYLATRDNSRARELYHQLHATMQRNQLIIDQTEAIVFEWDLHANTLFCNDQWQKHFGYDPNSEQYNVLSKKGHNFHPDDIPLIRAKIAALRSGSEQRASLDIRIANKDGRYIWMKLRGSAQRDQQGSVCRITGILTDIDDMKRAELTLKEQAERDALTKLLNKASTQQLIKDYLQQREPNNMAALLILDLDNFKSVNDTYGHLYGDAVLSQVGTHLRKLFRSRDIIGRIGGDEFLILLPDIPDASLVHDRCSLLLYALRELLQTHMPDLNISCSIGAALVPLHADSYAELFQHADDALYSAKKQGKNTYVLYDPAKSLCSLPAENSHSSSRIDSDEQPGMANSSFLRYIFQRLYESRNVKDTIHELLAYIGEQCRVSRVYIFENNETNTSCSNTFEWCSEGVSPEITNLQNLNFDTDLPGWNDYFDEQGVFYCSDVDQLPAPTRAIVASQGIKSLLLCAITEGGVSRGFVGFDDCAGSRLWDQEQIDLLSLLSKLIVIFLLKQRTQDKLTKQAHNLRNALDHQDGRIYVIDPDTCELKFLNEKARQHAPENHAGMTCYAAFMGRDRRCDNCPAANIHQDVSKTAVVDHQSIGIRARVHVSSITWNGEDACLISCHDLSDTPENRKTT